MVVEQLYCVGQNIHFSELLAAGFNLPIFIGEKQNSRLVLVEVQLGSLKLQFIPMI